MADKFLEIAHDMIDTLSKKVGRKEAVSVAAHMAQLGFIWLSVNGNAQEAAQIFDGFSKDTENRMRRAAKKKGILVP